MQKEIPTFFTMYLTGSDKKYLKEKPFEKMHILYKIVIKNNNFI